MKTPLFLLGAALMFWGWQTKLLIFAAIMAVVLEGTRFVKFRWDLSLADFKRVSDLCSVILIGMLFYLFVSQSFIDIVFILLQWLPLTFFPLLACQCYSTSGTVDIRALFLTLRIKPSKLKKEPITINLAYPYFILCILSAGAANIRTEWFYLGLFLLSAWALWSIRSRRYPAVLWISLLLLAGIGGYAGHINLHQLQLSLEQRALLMFSTSLQEKEADPYSSNTAIGDVGTVKLTNRVMFRVKSESGSHLLLREASYTTYQFSKWYAARSEFTDISPEGDGITWKLRPGLGEIPPGPPLKKGGTEQPASLEKEGTEQIQSGPYQCVTVSLYLKDGQGLLKLPTGTFQIEKLPVTIMVQNQFGALKVKEGPGLITYQALFSSQGSGDSPPTKHDLFIPSVEMPVISRLFEELALSSTSPKETLQNVSTFFQENFSYSLKLRHRVQNTTPLADFLLNSRAGHCEYFATATVLLLRAAGIPTRYAIGYSIDSLDKEGEWTIVRGRDAHAWTLVYLNGAWHDFDTTPPSWRQIEDEAASPFEWISAFWSRCRFTFSEWWWREERDELIKYLVWLLIPLFLIVGWRLYSKKRIKRVTIDKELKPESSYHPGADSEFYVIEKRLQELGFVRYPWEPLSHWIHRIERHASPLSRQSLHPILDLHYRYRFDPEGLTSAEKAALRSYVQSWLEQHEPELSR